LFPYIAAGIRECQPRIVFLENVEGIISAKTADGESVLQYVLRELEGLGYRATAGVFSAAEVGAPHQRKRVYILAHRNNTGLEGHHLDSTSEQGEPIQADTWATGGTRWPSRPSEPQHDREDPRVTAVADSDSKGLEGLRECNNSQGRQASNRQLGGGDQVWPSRPSEPQHDWEEPRVVVNSTSKVLERTRGKSLQGADKGLTLTDRSTGQAEPRLGGKSNGASSRVDRLRLLGNGVVPATAAKAFVTLIQRLND